mmetsp:Transcript_1931/g.4549  ORF Transcript_1931/g.4549 Transcript_1931/m.4549 type:complete len:256 (-) Transcript_1931:148-915(-)
MGIRLYPVSKISRMESYPSFVSLLRKYASSNGVIMSPTDLSRKLSAPSATCWAIFPSSAETAPREICSFNISMSSVRLWMVPTSLPSIQSRMMLMGLVITKNSIIRNRTIGTVLAPTCKAYREQAACGRISPKTTMSAVDTRKPTNPLAMSAVRIDSAEFTATLPNSNVHSSWLPDSRMGAIFSAHLASSLSSPFCTICRPMTSRPMSPRVSPEKRPDSITKNAMMGSEAQRGRDNSVSSASQSQGFVVFCAMAC